jgi:hypothetical protein
MRITREFQSKFAIEQSLKIFFIIDHDLTHEHILEAIDSSSIFGSTI